MTHTLDDCATGMHVYIREALSAGQEEFNDFNISLGSF